MTFSSLLVIVTTFSVILSSESNSPFPIPNFLTVSDNGERSKVCTHLPVACATRAPVVRSTDCRERPTTCSPRPPCSEQATGQDTATRRRQRGRRRRGMTAAACAVPAGNLTSQSYTKPHHFTLHKCRSEEFSKQKACNMCTFLQM